MARINLVTVVVGRRGTGKSTFVLNEVIKPYRETHLSQKVLIVDTLDHPLYRTIASIEPNDIRRWVKPNIYRCYSSQTNEVMKNITETLHNALVVFEDASKYIRGRVDDDIRRFILDSKQRNLDLIFVFHGFAFAPPEIWRLVDIITIFKTDNPASRKKDLVEYEQIQTAWENVMKNKDPFYNETIQIY